MEAHFRSLFRYDTSVEARRPDSIYKMDQRHSNGYHHMERRAHMDRPVRVERQAHMERPARVERQVRVERQARTESRSDAAAMRRMR